MTLNYILAFLALWLGFVAFWTVAIAQTRDIVRIGGMAIDVLCLLVVGLLAGSGLLVASDRVAELLGVDANVVLVVVAAMLFRLMVVFNLTPTSIRKAPGTSESH